MIRILTVCLGVVLGSEGLAQSALDAEERLLAAAGLLEAAESAGDRVAALTDTVRAYEAGLSAMRAEMRDLTLRERAIDQRLAAEEADISTLLAMMQNATQQAETQTLLHPGSAVDTIRAGTLAQALVPELYARAGELETQLQELEDIRLVLAAAEDGLSEGLSGVQSARIGLADALAARTDLPPRLATNEAAMEALVNGADTLSALADSVFSGQVRSSALSDAAWIMPVIGKVTEPFDVNAQRPGWSLVTESQALVVAPTDVSVRFSRTIPGSGQVVVVEADGGRLVLFSGLSASFVHPGEVLASGAPIGFAGQHQMAAQDKLNANEAESSLFADETVYIEIRQGGAPVDPAMVLTLEQEQG